MPTKDNRLGWLIQRTRRLVKGRYYLLKDSVKAYEQAVTEYDYLMNGEILNDVPIQFNKVLQQINRED